jgi:Pilus formation protein N terminal region
MASVCVRRRAKASPQRWLRAGLLAVALAAPAAVGIAAAAGPGPDDIIVVYLDRATLLQLPDRASTVVVGNPLIADLTIQPHGLAVITGKGYGATNFIVTDKKGAVLLEKLVEVMPPDERTVVVYRGITRQTYSCTPDCSRRITLGDTGSELFDGFVDKDFFAKTLEQTVNRNAQAAGAAAINGGR